MAITRTPIKLIPQVPAGIASPEVLVNEATLKSSISGGTLYLQDFDLNATPTGLDENDEGLTWKVGSSPTGQWSTDGAADMIATWDGTDWVYMDPVGATNQGTMLALMASAATSHAKEWWAYSPVEDDWHPVQEIYSTAEFWTGRYDSSGNKRYRKWVSFAMPNTTTSNVPHSITGIILTGADAPKLLQGHCTDGTTSFTLPLTLTTGIICNLSVTGTNVTVTDNFNLSTYTGYVLLDYSKS